MKTFAELDIENNGDYLKLLSAVSKLSGLFSESSVPFINYRVAENIFCKSFMADNLSRSDTAFDAKYNSIGIGLKTFTCNSNYSTEKVAEFNSLSKTLKDFKGKELAIKLAKFRNDRIDFANRLYDIKNSLYHIVARKEKELILFETDYSKIDINNINSIKDNNTSLKFEDGNNFYSFNYSKSTLYRKFEIPPVAYRLPIEIVEDPFSIILELLNNKYHTLSKSILVKGENYIVLPLYGIKQKNKFVYQKSGLNQWNAGGRQRNIGEMYLPIPIDIHKKFPAFFPARDIHFTLTIPTGESFIAKVCQDNSKALMTDPNKAMSDWLLRKVLHLKEGELATMEKLDALGFDSVIITKTAAMEYKIDIMKTDSYEKFIST